MDNATLDIVAKSRLMRDVQECVTSAVKNGRAAFSYGGCVRCNLMIDPCKGPLLVVVPMIQSPAWPAIEPIVLGDGYGFLRLMIATCLRATSVDGRPVVGDGGFTGAACKETTGAPDMPETLFWTWTPA